MSTLFKRIWQAFQDKEYRQVYTGGFSDSKIATQIKVLREQRGWTQQQLAEAVGMKQSRIATLEDVNYSSWSIRTLRRLAETFDLWLDVEFKEFGAVWPQLQNFNRESLTRRSFADDPTFKEGEAERTQTIQDTGITSAISSLIPAQAKASASALAFGLGSYGQPPYLPPSETCRTNLGNIPEQSTLYGREISEIQTPPSRHGALAAMG